MGAQPQVYLEVSIVRVAVDLFLERETRLRFETKIAQEHIRNHRDSHVHNEYEYNRLGAWLRCMSLQYVRVMHWRNAYFGWEQLRTRSRSGAGRPQCQSRGPGVSITVGLHRWLPLRAFRCT
jgi:hypothetical protein|eukprot:COSAG02_NODE_1413_length_12752_cov_4.305777_11_plen_122_part_00